MGGDKWEGSSEEGGYRELLATLITIVKFSQSMFLFVDLLFTKCDNCDNMVNLLFTNVGHPFTCEEGSLYYVLWWTRSQLVPVIFRHFGNYI